MRLLFLGFGFTLCALPVMAQQASPDILTIWDQFSISNVIVQESCDGPRVQEALRRFDFQADLDFLAATKQQKGQ